MLLRLAFLSPRLPPLWFFAAGKPETLFHTTVPSERTRIMAATKTKRAAVVPRSPEKKYGPFHGGVGVAIWVNEVQTDDGPRVFRSVQITPRRYRDKDGKWQDAESLRVNDLPSLILALESAHRFAVSTPLPGQVAEEEQIEEPVPPTNGDIPF